MEDQIGSVIYGQLVHVPNDFLARRKIRSEFLLLKEFIKLREGVTLIPASTLSHKPLTKGIDRVIKIYRSAQQREDVVARHFIATILRHEHRLEFDVDIDFLE